MGTAVYYLMAAMDGGRICVDMLLVGWGGKSERYKYTVPRISRIECFQSTEACSHIILLCSSYFTDIMDDPTCVLEES